MSTRLMLLVCQKLNWKINAREKVKVNALQEIYHDAERRSRSRLSWGSRRWGALKRTSVSKWRIKSGLVKKASAVKDFFLSPSLKGEKEDKGTIR